MPLRCAGFRDQWATICPSPPLERRARLELAKSGVAIRRLVHFSIRRVVKELGGRGEGRTLMPEGAGS